MDRFRDNSYVGQLITLLNSDLDFHDQPGNLATHNFHSFPAKFPPQLPRLFIDHLTQDGDVVLDPMAGSGTSIIEACRANRRAIGFDIDPLALNIIRVKTTPADWQQLKRLEQGILTNAEESIRGRSDEIADEIKRCYDAETRIFLDKWFYPDTQIELQALMHEIQSIDDPTSRAFFEVAFSAIIITKSGGVSLALDLGHTRPHLPKLVVDRKGKILVGNSKDHIPAYQTKILKPVLPEFHKRCSQNYEGILGLDRCHYPPEIQYSDAQNLPLADGTVDLIVTSPPYASNAIDYMRAHKFSLVWLGHPINELSQKRNNYIGGESVNGFKFESLPKHSEQVVSAIALLDDGKAASLHRYYSEMTRVLGEMFRVLRPGKVAIVVVGNSVMRGIDTEIPLCLAEIGATKGFEIPIIGVRQLDRDRRMLPVADKLNTESQIQQRMQEEHVIGFYKPL